MPFLDTNSHLTTKPYNFDIQCQSNSESYDRHGFFGTKFRWGQIYIFFFYGWKVFQQERVLWGWLDGPSHIVLCTLCTLQAAQCSMCRVMSCVSPMKPSAAERGRTFPDSAGRRSRRFNLDNMLMRIQNITVYHFPTALIYSDNNIIFSRPRQIHGFSTNTVVSH